MYFLHKVKLLTDKTDTYTFDISNWVKSLDSATLKVFSGLPTIKDISSTIMTANLGIKKTSITIPVITNIPISKKYYMLVEFKGVFINFDDGIINQFMVIAET